MRHPFVLLLISALFASSAVSSAAQDDYQPGPDSIAQPNVPKGELIKGTYAAKEGSVFPGTERDYTIYLPAGSADTPVGTSKTRDKSVPAPFMVFQDGVIYQAPTVFDNLISKKEIPPLIGIFIRPGVVPAANPNALPRYNRSYEYDSVSDTYARFLIEEFLPAIETRHGIKLSKDPNDAAISGNSSGGICAFMVAWHRPDRFRRVFTGVGTYVGIHGADQLPVLVRKFEPKPLRIYLQSGEQDNNLYCGDWWMANQMMERSLTWAGYDVNHTWGTGGHNAKQATAIFPDVLRWLWKDFSTAKEVKANPRGESKWRGYEVVGDGKWENLTWDRGRSECSDLTAHVDGTVFGRVVDYDVPEKGDPQKATAVGGGLLRIRERKAERLVISLKHFCGLATHRDGNLRVVTWEEGPFFAIRAVDTNGKIVGEAQKFPVQQTKYSGYLKGLYIAHSGDQFSIDTTLPNIIAIPGDSDLTDRISTRWTDANRCVVSDLVLSPDQTYFYVSVLDDPVVLVVRRGSKDYATPVEFYELQPPLTGKVSAEGLCVDTNGWLYVATALGIQVCDQAGRVNFIIPTPRQPHDVCFGGKDLSELFIACGDTIYKRPTKARGIVSGQMAPIKPAAPKL